jgi:hypothetical protein
MAARSPFLRKRFLVPLGGLAVLALALVALNPGRLARDLVIRQASRALGRPVSVQAVRTSFVPDVRVRLSGLTIPEAAGSPLASLSLETLELRLAPLPLLRRELLVTSVALTKPQVVLRAGATPPGGQAAPAAPAGSPLRVAVRKLTIRDGALTVLRADGAPLVELAGLTEDLTASLSRGGELALAGETAVASLRLHLPQGVLGDGLTARWRKDLTWTPGPRTLRVAESTLQLGDLAVGVSGQLAGLGAPRPQADLQFRGGPVQVASLVGFVPTWLAPQLAGTTSGGEVAVAGFLKGPLGPPSTAGGPLPFSWELAFDLANGRVSAPSLPAPVSGIEVHLRAHDDTVELARFAAATPTSRLAVSGTVTSLLAAPQVALKIDADVDLKEALALQPPQPGQPEMSGRVSGVFDVTGPIAPPTALVMAGAGRLRDVKMSGPDLKPAIDRIDGAFRLDGRRLTADGVVYRQGTTDVTVTGTVDNWLALVPELKVAPPAVLAATVDGRMLDADQYAAPRGAPKESAAQSAGLQRLALLGGSADVTMKRLLTRGQELQDVKGVVAFDRGRLTLKGVRGTLYGGRADLAGTVDLSDPAHGTMDLDVTLAGVQAQELSRRAVAMSRFARLGGFVTGLVDGRATLKGALDDTFGLDLMTFSTAGQIEIREAKLAGSPAQKKLAALLAAPQLEAVAVSQWLQPFRVEGGKLHIDGLKLTAGGVGVRAGGWQALDGTVAMGLELTVPPALAQGLRSRLPAAVATALLDGPGAPLVVPVGLSGRWDDPQVTLDVDALTAAARDRAAAQVRGQADRLVGEAKQKAADAVAGQAARLLGGGAGTTADTAVAGADTAQAGNLQDQVKSILKGLRGGKGK